VTFKLATLTYNIKSTGQPVHLRNLLSVVCTLRSSSKRLSTVVNVSDTVLATHGLRHSAVATVYLTIFVALLTFIFLNVASKLIYLTLHSPLNAGQSVSMNSFHATWGTLNMLLPYLPQVVSRSVLHAVTYRVAGIVMYGLW